MSCSISDRYVWAQFHGCPEHTLEAHLGGLALCQVDTPNFGVYQLLSITSVC